MIHYSLLSNLFRYPDAAFVENINSIQQFLNTNYKEAGKELERFTKWVNETDLYKQEELFTKTFHIQAICYLDLGYVLFGEDYKRGDFLANMKVEQEKMNVDLENELADNILNVLKLISIHEDKEFVSELCARIVIPAVKKMLIEFDATKIKNRMKLIKKQEKVLIMEDVENGNIYQNVLNALLHVLDADFGHLKYEEFVYVPEFSKDFVGDCNTCTPKLNFNQIRKS